MILKSDAKFGKELTCRFKIEMRNCKMATSASFSKDIRSFFANHGKVQVTT